MNNYDRYPTVFLIVIPIKLVNLFVKRFPTKFLDEFDRKDRKYFHSFQILTVHKAPFLAVFLIKKY